jgi:hypothetical protein
MKAEMAVVLLNVNDPEPAIKAVDATLGRSVAGNLLVR